jgi:phage FluMu gp28-like protein
MRDEDRSTALDEGQGEICSDNLEVQIFKTVDELAVGYVPEIHGRLFLGFDVARHRDASVIFLIGQLDNGKKRSVAEIEMLNTPFRIQKQNMRRILNELPVVRGTMDRSGLGMQLCEELQEEFGETRLEGMDFTPSNKELLAVGVKKGLENREFLLQNDKKFQRQVHSIKRIGGTGKIMRYDSQRDSNGHADSFWAWALSDYAVIEGKKRTNFYDEWASNKNKTVLPSNNNEPSSNNAPEALTIRRGKSLHSVLGGLQNAYK